MGRLPVRRRLATREAEPNSVTAPHRSSVLGSLFLLVLVLPSFAIAHEEERRSEDYALFPEDEFFDPLIADLRWPRFSASHQWRLGTDDFNRAAQVSFGESFAFYQSPDYDWGRWEFGLHAMVDAIFDMQPSLGSEYSVQPEFPRAATLTRSSTLGSRPVISAEVVK